MMRYFTMRAKQVLGSRKSSLILLAFRKSGDPSNPVEVEIPVVTPEQGKHFADLIIDAQDIERVEVVDTVEGEVLYARGYRKAPEAPVQRTRDDGNTEQGQLFSAVSATGKPVEPIFVPHSRGTLG